MKLKILVMAFLFASSSLFAKESNPQQSDFQKPIGEWVEIKSKGHTGDQKLLKIIDNGKNTVYLYWMSPGSETEIQTHDQYEEVIITQGTLYWLTQNKTILKKLAVGSYVDRKPKVAHGPFKAGPNGCLMYVRFHA